MLETTTKYTSRTWGKGSRSNLQPSPPPETDDIHPTSAQEHRPYLSLTLAMGLVRIWGGRRDGGGNRPSFNFVGYKRIPTTAQDHTLSSILFLSIFSHIFDLLRISCVFVVVVAACVRLCVGRLFCDGKKSASGMAGGGEEEWEEEEREGEIMGWHLPPHVSIKITRECKTDFLMRAVFSVYLTPCLAVFLRAPGLLVGEGA